jgi:hypothetical protein
MIDQEIFIPYNQQRLVSAVHAVCRVLAESHDERGTHMRLRAMPQVVARLKAQLDAE